MLSFLRNSAFIQILVRANLTRNRVNREGGMSLHSTLLFVGMEAALLRARTSETSFCSLWLSS